MDDELERLERAHRQDPTPESAARLQAALLRLGRRDELRARYRLGFACDQRWDDMRPADRWGRVRTCQACRRQVHLARSYAEFDRLAAQGHCVAVVPSNLPKVLDGLIDAGGRPLARGHGDPCLLEGQEPPPPPPPPRPLAGVPVALPPPPPKPPT